MTRYQNEVFLIESELDDIVDKLGSPSAPDDIDALIARRNVLHEKLKVLRGRQSAAKDEEYKAGLQARREQFYADLSEPLEWLRATLPRVRYELVRLAELEARLAEEGTGKDWGQITNGLPYGAASRIQDAIGSEVRNSPWEELYCPPAVQRIIDAARPLVAKHKAQQAEREAERRAEYARLLAEFEAGRGPDPRPGYRVAWR